MGVVAAETEGRTPAAMTPAVSSSRGPTLRIEPPGESPRLVEAMAEATAVSESEAAAASASAMIAAASAAADAAGAAASVAAAARALSAAGASGGVAQPHSAASASAVGQTHGAAAAASSANARSGELGNQPWDRMVVQALDSDHLQNRTKGKILFRLRVYVANSVVEIFAVLSMTVFSALLPRRSFFLTLAFTLCVCLAKLYTLMYLLANWQFNDIRGSERAVPTMFEDLRGVSMFHVPALSFSLSLLYGCIAFFVHVDDVLFRIGLVAASTASLVVTVDSAVLIGKMKNLWRELRPTKFVKDDGRTNEAICAICLENFEADEMTLMLPCSHVFHHECVVKWIQLRQCCPLRCSNAVMVVIPSRSHELKAPRLWPSEGLHGRSDIDPV